MRIVSMRRWRVAFAAAAVVAVAGCGAEFKLPTEQTTGRDIPSDGSYQMLSTWTAADGMADIQDILLTQGAGSQLFMLFNPGTGPLPRGEVRAYPFTRPTPITGIAFPGLLDPVAITSGGNRVFVLDLGDTCLARRNPKTQACGDTTSGWDPLRPLNPFDFRVTDLTQTWRVREYGLLGGDTISTFTDNRFGWVTGIAADADGNVYVAGTAIINVADPDANPPIFTRTFLYRIYKYVRGASVPPDISMPGAAWHRDPTFEIEEGSGIGTVVDPRGIAWSGGAGNALYATDFGKNWIQKLSDTQASVGFFSLDGGRSGTPFNGPTDVAVDAQGFMYIADTGNQRVVRYGPDQDYIQDVNVEPDEQGELLVNPVAVAADDSLVYVGERTLGKVIRYKRRK